MSANPQQHLRERARLGAKDAFCSRRAFTLIEILITIFIIALALLLYQGALSAVFLGRNAGDQEIALRIATRKLEEVRALGYASIPADGPFSDAQLASLRNATTALSSTDVSLKTKEVTITILWQEPHASASSTVTLATRITQIGGL